ncbi:Phosphoglycerate mutase [Dehalogenimonas lykanthroporepellens BL-DC-9]|nr:Phosphoglycerate mutase [Dehalogenimonas lykanthroporepellens BL-DC-9]
MKLILVRHGEIASAGTGICYGSTDVPLSEKGRTQAAALQKRFAMERIETFYSSTLQRGRDTADIVSRLHSKTVKVDEAINEVNFGRIEQQTYDWVLKEYPDIAELWLSGSTEIAFPGGENFQSLIERSTMFIQRVIAEHGPGDTVMIVSHGGPLRIIICHLLGIPVSHHWQLTVERASVSILRLTGDKAVLDCLNDMSHCIEIEGTT